jgi:hypothetical protein
LNLPKDDDSSDSSDEDEDEDDNEAPAAIPDFKKLKLPEFKAECKQR